MTLLVIRARDAEDLITLVAEKLLSEFVALSEKSTPSHVVLTGGRTAHEIVRSCAHSSLVDRVNWSMIHIWWSDERFLPRTDAERNDRVLLVESGPLLPLPLSNIHCFGDPSDGDVDDVAHAYAERLSSWMTQQGSEPFLHLSLLSLGEDGHIASQFPGFREHANRGIVAVVRDTPKPPPVRMTLTPFVLNSAEHVWIVASGLSKASAVSKLLDSESRAPVALASKIVGKQTTTLIADADALSSSNGLLQVK